MGLISRVSSRTYRKLALTNLLTTMEKENKVAEQQVEESNIRITISAQSPKAVDKACSEICSRAKAINSRGQDSLIKIKGPRPMPTRRMRITTRKTPCGEGSKTWDRYQMRIHKRVIEFVCGQSQILNITQVQLEPGVHVELTLPEQ